MKINTHLAATVRATALLLGATFIPINSANAFSFGITGYSGNPATSGGAICSQCHAGGIAPTVTLNGPTLVQPGSTNTYTLTLSGGQQIVGGVDVSASGGTLTTTQPNTTIRTGEFVHTARIPVDANGEVIWTFNWQAPTAAGTYTLYGSSLSANRNGMTTGDSAAAVALDIAVGGGNQPPLADAAGPYTGTAGSAVMFDASASSDADGTIVTYSWDFGDGGTGTGMSPSHTYSASGTYTVTLTVTDDAGATATATATATISGANQPPTADAGGPYSGTVNTAVQFDASASNDVDGTIVSYSWDFGDGGTGSGMNPTHVYTVSGSYSVSVTVTDDSGSTATASSTVSIAGLAQPPVASIGGPYSGTVGNPVQFDASGSSDADGAIASFSWDFGDGGTSTVMSPTHNYAAAGTYSVTLTVTDNDGLTDIATTSATIAAASLQPPTANAGGPYTASLGAAVQFDASGSADADGNIVSYAWDFGDGMTGTGVNASHTYGMAGAYNVSLVVTDNDGLTGTAQTAVEIFSGATPSIMKFDVPRKVELEEDETKRKSIEVVSAIDGLSAGAQQCGTVFLLKNGDAYMEKSICLSASSDDDANEVKFRYTFSADDAPSVEWTTYMVLDSGAESQRITKTTQVQGEGEEDRGDDEERSSSSSNGDPALGQQAYDLNCAMCHGAGGSGGSVEAVVGESASSISSAIVEVPEMGYLSSFLTAEDVANIAAYLNPAANVTTGAQAYETNCAGCHGVGGTGGMFEGVLGESASDITKAIATEPQMSFLGSYLSASDIEAIAAYLDKGRD